MNKNLAEKLKKESQLVREESLKVLSEFEKMDGLKPMFKNKIKNKEDLNLTLFCFNLRK
jgi:hypothetical protein